jgi:hypothetical protein
MWRTSGSTVSIVCRLFARARIWKHLPSVHDAFSLNREVVLLSTNLIAVIFTSALPTSSSSLVSCPTPSKYTYPSPSHSCPPSASSQPDPHASQRPGPLVSIHRGALGRSVIAHISTQPHLHRFSTPIPNPHSPSTQVSSNGMSKRTFVPLQPSLYAASFATNSPKPSISPFTKGSSRLMAAPRRRPQSVGGE